MNKQKSKLPKSRRRKSADKLKPRIQTLTRVVPAKFVGIQPNGDKVVRFECPDLVNSKVITCTLTESQHIDPAYLAEEAANSFLNLWEKAPNFADIKPIITSSDKDKQFFETIQIAVEEGPWTNNSTITTVTVDGYPKLVGVVATKSGLGEVLPAPFPETLKPADHDEMAAPYGLVTVFPNSRSFRPDVFKDKKFGDMTRQDLLTLGNRAALAVADAARYEDLFHRLARAVPENGTLRASVFESAVKELWKELQGSSPFDTALCRPIDTKL